MASTCEVVHTVSILRTFWELIRRLSSESGARCTTNNSSRCVAIGIVIDLSTLFKSLKYHHRTNSTHLSISGSVGRVTAWIPIGTSVPSFIFVVEEWVCGRSSSSSCCFSDVTVEFPSTSPSNGSGNENKQNDESDSTRNT